MKTIWKYPLKIVDEQTLQIPLRSKILSVKNHGGTITLWFEVDSAYPKNHEVQVYIVGTGNPIVFDHDRDRPVFLDSVVVGDFVWHVYIKE